MNRAFWGRLAKLLAAVGIAAMASAWALGQVGEAELARRDQQEVARMTRKIQTVCIGRFLVDRPEEARLELARPRIHGFDIASFDEPEADFQVRLGQREARLRATPDRLGGNRNLESERGADVDAKLSTFDKARVSSLRASPRTINGMAGDELVTRYAEKNDAIVHTFWWEVNRTEDNVLIPHLSLTMETGNGGNGPVRSSLSQDAAMAPWDRISSSIRLRPTTASVKGERQPGS